MALSIGRKLGQAIMIGDSIRITLTKSEGRGGFRLLVEAPRDIQIWREEVYRSVKSKDAKPEKKG